MLDEPEDRAAAPVSPTHVVALGASAGGLESLQQVFAALPHDTGMTFLVAQHLSPDFKSLMPDLLGRQTRMPVLAVDRDLPLRPDTVYVLSAGFAMEVQGPMLRALPRAHDGDLNMPINRLFASLEALGDRAAAVVLSGTGQDGMVGARLVRQAGGLVVAQAPASARFDSMPRALIDAGLADIVALPGEIGPALVAWKKDPVEGRRFTSEANAAGERDSLLDGPYAPVLQLLQRVFDLDFSHYKPGTIMRRVDRWLGAGGRAASPAALATYLEGRPADTDRLFGDLLIGVTSFFRDPEVFDALAIQGLDRKVDQLGARDTLRMWCCGCSTGEEAYSLAMLALEVFERRGQAPRVRVLATDVHPPSVQRAAAGVFPAAALETLPEALRGKYFTALPSGEYKVTEALRRHVVFSVHNVMRDPGFQRVDLVTCRNLLIYLRPQAQKAVLALFHIALNPDGLLMLGKSELPTEQGDAFEAVDDSAHLYRKRAGLLLPAQPRPLFGPPPVPRPSPGSVLDNRATHRLQEVLAQRYVPDGFLVNQSDELIYVFGGAGRYLRAAPGRFGGTMFNLLCGPLRTAVTMALRQSAQGLVPISVADVPVEGSEAAAGDEAPPRVRIEVEPVVDRALPHHYFMVRVVAAEPAPARQATALDPDASAHIADLQTELMRTREALQRSIEDLEAANEELQAGNEELMAANEELQSSNEELHALNEELYSVNSEHEAKIQELRDTTADLNNLIRATELPIVFLDLEGRLRLFTPPAVSLFPLRQEDVGRELRDLVPLESDPELFGDIGTALVGGDSHDHELTLRDGRIMRRRVAPYRNAIGVTSGLVISYVDITQQVAWREQQLQRQHEAQMRALMDALPQLMWTCNADGGMDFVNPQWVAYTGQDATADLGRGWLQRVHPDDRAALESNWAEALRQRRPWRARARLQRADSAWRWFDHQATPQLGESGQALKWFGTSTDVHELTLLQRAMEERERFTQMVADNVNGMVSYWDREQRNRFANGHYLEWLGRSAEAVRGRTLRELVGDEAAAAEQPRMQAALQGEAQQFERTVEHDDGSIAHLWVEYRPHRVDGEVQGLVATATEITQVQEARALLDRVFMSSPVAQLVVDHQGHLARWNPAARQLLGFDDGQLGGLPLDVLVPAPLRQRHAHLYRAFMAEPRHRPMGDGRTFPLVRGDGTQLDVEIDISGVQMAGRPASIAFIREAESATWAQQRQDLALQARSNFLAQMSHEIRTPLNAILGMAQLLEMEQPTAKQLDRLRRIEEASNLLLGIVNDVLDLSKMEAGKLQLAREPFALRAVLDHSMAMVAEKARLKRLTLTAQVEPGVPATLYGDARRLEQILVNLLGNAVKFTHAGSVQVRASVAPASDQRVALRVEVADTGIGIPSEEIGSLFTPFRQVQQGHGRRFGGTGLGLSICRQLARAMNGECGVQSSPGVGSTFWFTALLEDAPGDTAALPAPPPAVPADYVDRRVLVVEDNEINRSVIRELLTACLAVQVVEAKDGLQALQIATVEPLDLVLMDVQLPGIDGLETTRRMRRIPALAQVPIYALTANVHAEDVNACLKAGMDGHFGKPLDIDRLMAEMKRLWAPAASPARSASQPTARA